MITREATIEDWDKLALFFKSVYSQHHPLHQKVFWDWQYGNPKYGRSFISLNDDDQVTGHVGASFGGEIAWIINVYLNEECRGKGILRRLYDLARNYFPLAATAANAAGLGLYRNMRWIRYHDLVRMVRINPKFEKSGFNMLCEQTDVAVDNLIVSDTHYFQQPTIKGILLEDGSRAVSQESVGGLRICDFEDINSIEQLAWEKGYKWLDYITSWNDLKIKGLEKNNWVVDCQSLIPWRLNPVVENYFCDITFLSEAPLDKDFVVHRSFSDHGRVGSIDKKL